LNKFEIDIFFKKLQDSFIEKFIRNKKEKKYIPKSDSFVNILSPGRVNIIGEHTDYNLGLAISTAINKYIFLTGLRGNSENIEVYSKYFNDYYKFLLSDITLDKNILWVNYIKGVLKEYIQNNYKLGGFSVFIDSNLPIGAGISSSAALEVGIAKFIEELFNLAVDRKETVKYCHSAENNFVGTKCGLLDQLSAVYGKENYAIFINFKDLSYEYIPFDLKDNLILIIDSKEERKLSNTEYNKRRMECSNATKIIASLVKNRDISSLADIDLNLLYKSKGNLPEKLFRRAKHVINENNRVLLSKDCLLRGDIKKLGLILLESHNSLRYDYEVSTEKLNFLVDEVAKIRGVHGARLMGAGFGGSVISIVNRNRINDIIDILGKKFFKNFGIIPNFIEALTSEGTRRVN